ncbi:GntR family transcriptional regulator [Bogoriella caseilytica]|uniref:DNA-binding transcriptional regulator YhcF (GntR family) n=1 Tax=Bogoriella caseilytica TaxID=56055 RepID=A0A3N2BFD9_9MICO|nr:GntR family transcriptional regulator [Bogoriella caseilytica]ROR73981.1 DNA-binding transcriptional regulator YhcF (GntR family) [Bogoriella caseilytica]
MFDGPEPIYIQIAEYLRREVLSEALGPGDQVMSTTQFATSYRINPATAAKAFTILVDEGVLEKRRGLGMFVTEGARHRLLEQRRAAFFTDRLDPVLAEARSLGLDPQTLIDHIRKGGAP